MLYQNSKFTAGNSKNEYMKTQDSTRNTFNIITLALLPHNDRTLLLDNEIMLSDMDDCPPAGSHAEAVRLPEWQKNGIFRISFMLALLCQSGTMRFRINLTEHVLEKDSLLIVVPGTICEYIEVSRDCRLTMIALSEPDTFRDISNQTAVIMHRYVSKQPMIALSADDTAEFLSIYRAMRRKVEQEDFSYRKEVVRCYLQVVYCNLCHLMKPYIELEDRRLQDRQKQIYDRFMQELLEHGGTRRDITFYAGLLCLTPKYLSQVIFAVSGRHAKEWIRDYVILEAKVLLKSGRYTSQQVSDMLNFPNQSFFGTYFKRSVGCSPKMYQENK